MTSAKDEAENLPSFVELADAAFRADGARYEIVVIDDGSVDDTWEVLQRLAERYPYLRRVRCRTGRR